MPSSQHTSRSPRYAYDSDSETDDGYHRRPLSSSRTREYRDRDGYDRKSSRKNSPGSRHRGTSLAKMPEQDDADAWDTDYDPKDKYYLSAEDDPYNLYGPERKMTQYQEGERGLEHDRKHSSPRRSHHHHHSDRHDSSDRRKASSAAKPKSSSGAPASSRPRPRTHRAGSSFTTPSRPRTLRAGSSYTAASTRPRMNRGVSHAKSKSRRPGTTRAVSHGGTGKSVRTKPRPIAQIPWGTAATSALEAGAVAAIKASHGPGPLSQKGAKVVTAALGAAVVDTFLSTKMPKKKGGIRHAAMREVAEATLGNFVVGPIAGGGGRRRRR